MIKKIVLLSFSPTGNTKKCLSTLAEGIAEKLNLIIAEEIDITSASKRENDYEFDASDLVIIGFPTYAGRLPNKIMPYLKEHVHANGALGCALVTYGNRAYDNSLKELASIMCDNGFKMISAMAVPCEHAFAQSLATGRPTEVDLEEIKKYGRKIGERITLQSSDSLSTNVMSLMPDENFCIDISKIPGDEPTEMKYYVPKKEDGTPANFLKAMPKTDSNKCGNCGECVKACPMNCFEESITEPKGVCIKCQACIKACKNGAKYFDDEEFLSHKKYLEDRFTENKKIEMYI